MSAEMDPKISQILQAELDRQRQSLELIASENFTSKAVMDIQGSVLTNKYAEGYPGKRYYGGCEHVDQAEDLARDRMTAALDTMRGDTLAPPEHVDELRGALHLRFGTQAFRSCKGMGDLTATLIRLMVEGH